MPCATCKIIVSTEAFAVNERYGFFSRPVALNMKHKDMYWFYVLKKMEKKTLLKA